VIFSPTIAVGRFVSAIVIEDRIGAVGRNNDDASVRYPTNLTQREFLLDDWAVMRMVEAKQGTAGTLAMLAAIGSSGPCRATTVRPYRFPITRTTSFAPVLRESATIVFSPLHGWRRRRCPLGISRALAGCTSGRGYFLRRLMGDFKTRAVT
jgi:hypothetical protein